MGSFPETFHDPFRVKGCPIGQFTVVCSVPWPLDRSEAAGAGKFVTKQGLHQPLLNSKLRARSTQL